MLHLCHVRFTITMHAVHNSCITLSLYIVHTHREKRKKIRKKEKERKKENKGVG